MVMENSSAAWPHVTGVIGYKHNIFQPTQNMGISEMLAPLFEAMQMPPPPSSETPLVYKHEWTFALSVTQNIYTCGRLYNAIKLARQYKQTAEQQAILTDKDLVLEITEAYYQVVMAKGMADVAHVNYDLADQHFKNVKAKYDAGIKSEFDFLQSQASLAQARPSVISADSGVEISLLNLKRVIGLPMGQPIQLTDDFREVFPTVSATEQFETAKTNRTELVLLNLQGKMNRTTRNLYISNMLPSINAQMDYSQVGYSIYDEDKIWPEEDDEWYQFWSVGLNFVWPIFDGLESYGKARQAKAEMVISDLRTAQTVKGIELEISQLVNQMEANKAEVAAGKESVSVAKKAFELASLRFDSGLGTALEKDDAKGVWTQARLALIHALYNLDVTHAKLVRAVGKDSYQ